jgi:hypothetical protein
VFLQAKGLDARDIHKETFPVYSGKYLSCKAVHTWVADDAQEGHPVEIATEATVQWVDKLSRADRIMSVATALRRFHGLAYSKMHDLLEVSKSVHTDGPQRTEGSRKN